MSCFKIQGPCRINGQIDLPGDKSIAQRLVIFSCLAENPVVINNFPFNKDCLAAIEAFKSLGIKIIANFPKKQLKIWGKGLAGLKKPSGPIFVSESGTTLRLLLGVLAGQSFQVKLTCAESLARRPMLRVTAPLRKMGAEISCRKNSQGEEYPPLTIQGKVLAPLTYKMPAASAQVKSAILLAGLYTQGVTRVIEPLKTRDHTERLLKAFGAKIRIYGRQISIKGKQKLFAPKLVYLPGDISSAAFFMVMAAILKDSRIILKNVSLNPCRLGVYRVLKRMGADIQVIRGKGQVEAYEPLGDIEVKSSILKGVTIKNTEIPSLIDELPVLMIAACCAQNKSRFEGVGELRVKETDRIKSMLKNLRKMGADIQVISDKGQGVKSKSKATSREDIIINPVKNLKGAQVQSFGDHRTAMSMIVAGLSAHGATSIDDTTCISKSFPNFLRVLKSIMR